MNKTKYFVQTASTSLPIRYFIIDGGRVTKIQASRPDGQEVSRPIGVKIDLDSDRAKVEADSFKYHSFSFSGNRADLAGGRKRAIERMQRQRKTQAPPNAKKA